MSTLPTPRPATLSCRRGLAFHPVEVGHHRLHVGRLHRQRLAVHRAQEAAVDAVFERDDSSRARGVAREERGNADEGRTVGDGAAIQVAAGAVQIVGDVLRQQCPGLQVQAHAADQLLGVGLRQQRRQARRLECGRIRDLGVEVAASPFHLIGIDGPGVVAPALAHEAQDVRQLLVGQAAEGRHGVDARIGSGLRRLPAREGDVKQRRGIGRGDRRIAPQRREDAFDAGAVLAMAVDAELHIAQAAGRCEQLGRQHRRIVADRNRGHRHLVLARRQRLQVGGDGDQVRHR